MLGNNDVYVERSQQSLAGNIMGSIVASFFGLLIVVGSIYLEIWNEGRAVKDHQSLQTAARGLVSLSAANFDPSNEGKVIYMNGTVVTKKALIDPDFDIKLQALRIIRSTSMYQWTEDRESSTDKKVGGGSETVTTYTYEKEWQDKIVDSSSFRESSHGNPKQFKFPERNFTADDATMGAYDLTPKLLDVIATSTPLTIAANVDTAKLPASNVCKITAAGDSFYAGADPLNPAIGDEKISFCYVPSNQVISLVGLQSGKSIQPFRAAGGTTFELVKTGEVSAADLFKGAETQNQIMTWCLRLLGVFLMFIGLLMMASPLSAVLNIIPFVGSVAEVGSFMLALGLSWTGSLLVIGFAWLAVRPMLGYALIGGAFLLLLLTVCRPSAQK